MEEATFFEHKVDHDGLHIRSMLNGNIITTFIEREDAEMFGWIDPCDCPKCQTEEESRGI